MLYKPYLKYSAVCKRTFMSYVAENPFVMIAIEKLLVTVFIFFHFINSQLGKGEGRDLATANPITGYSGSA